MTIAQTQLSNAKVSLFFDPVFVDTGAGANEEGTNIKQTLETGGHTVSTFVGVDTNAWRAATVGADIIIIPETPNGPNLVLSAGAQYFLRQFISNGGTLIVHGDDDDNIALMNTLFGTTLEEVSSSGNSSSTVSIGETTYAGGPATLPDNASTDALKGTSLPTFAESLYQNAAGDSTVAAFQFGKGQIVYLGWDWANALPAPGTQDGGWNAIMQRSMSHSDGKTNGLYVMGTKKNDTVKVDSGKKLESSNLDDVMTLGKGNDKAWGGGGHDVFDGGAGNDKLRGDAGMDFLNGGKGKDKLWGGADADYFLFDQKAGGKHADSILDFVDGEDFIVLKQSKFSDLTLGEMTALQFTTHIEYKSNGWLTYDGQKFAKLQSGGLAIDHADFLVI